MATILSVKDLKVHFFTAGRTVRALDGVSFEIEEGKTFGLVGETGCGKSVTALSILRLIPFPPGKIMGGEVHFRGNNLLSLSEEEIRSIRGKEISMIFQEPMTSLNPVFRIGDQMSEVIRLHQKLDHSRAWAKAEEMLERVQIPDARRVAKQFPHQLSGGMRQRVMIAMELSCHPYLLIADEPTTALDVTIQAQILRLIKEMKREFHTSILLITHDLGIIAEMCERVGVMYAGSIVEEAGVEEIFEAPRHPYTRGLWGAIPRIDEEKEALSVIPGMVPDLSNPPTGCRFHPRCAHRFGPCGQGAPSLLAIAPGHLVACFLYRERGEHG
jgi:peptide/nickel transport system ATP-binding protein/oligopeptide transport system ATP-binding protein